MLVLHCSWKVGIGRAERGRGGGESHQEWRKWEKFWRGELRKEETVRGSMKWETWALNMSVLPWQFLRLFFILCIKFFVCQWIWERDRQKVRCVLGKCHFCCLFSWLNVWIYLQGPSHDFYYLYFGSEKAIGVINWCISLFLPPSILSPPLSLMLSETHFERHPSQTLPLVAFSHTQCSIPCWVPCPPLDPFTPECPENHSITGLLQHVI